MMSLRTRVTCILVASAALVGACSWDSDTLAEEARGGELPTIKVIVGAFDRNPPLYYQMRLERVAKEILANAAKLALYDDAGVAADRLGRQDEAIAWMVKKEAAMKAGTPTSDDRYRYHANLGTFYAHRWTKNGSNLNKPEDLDKGLAHLKKAVEINPDAHFGREKYQIAILEWIKTKPVTNNEDQPIEAPLAEYLREKNLMDSDKGLGDEDRSSKAIEGLSGIIRLGTGWESVDIFGALAHALADNRDGTTGEAAMARVDELQKLGKKSISGWIRDPKTLFIQGGSPFAKENARREFTRLRAEAEKNHQRRTEFMLAKLKQGKHPDTDADFWSGYVDRAIEVKDVYFWQKPGFWVWPGIITAIIVVFVLPVVLSIIIFVKVRRRRRAANLGA